MRRRTALLPLMVTLVLLAACLPGEPSTPVMPTQPPATPIPSSTPGLETQRAEALETVRAAGTQTALAPTLTPAPTRTLPPPITNTPLPVLADSGPVTDPHVDFAGITLEMAPGLMTSWRGVTLPATSPDVMAPDPYHHEIRFEGYPVASRSGFAPTPLIYVSPVEGFAGFSDAGLESIRALGDLLSAQRGQIEGPIPQLPLLHAGQLFHAQERYLTFANGSGIRFLTMLAQDMYPAANDNLFYVFEGLASDGSVLVVAFFPVAHPDLPATISEVPGDFYSTYDQYRLDLIQMLNATDPAAFEPDLSVLDAIMATLAVNPSPSP